MKTFMGACAYHIVAPQHGLLCPVDTLRSRLPAFCVLPPPIARVMIMSMIFDRFSAGTVLIRNAWRSGSGRVRLNDGSQRG